MTRRIAIGELKQESNTFVRARTTLEQFRDFHLWHGNDLLDRLRDTNTEVGGFLDVCDARYWQPVPTLAAFAISGGPLAAGAFAALRDDLLRRLEGAAPLDGVLLALHGAMVAEGEDDPDGATLEAVRALIGPHTPLVVSLDLHANVTRRMAAHADALVGFKTCPHVDQRDTGRRAAEVLARRLEGGARPVTGFAKLPMVTPASLHVHDRPGPFKRLMDASRDAEQGSVLSASIFTVQPWLDIPEFGYATVAVADGDRELADATARRLADLAWSERHALADVELVPADEAVRRALGRPDGPVVLSELADGTGAGSPGDATAALAALLAARPGRTALAWIYDPDVAAEAAAAGVGATIDTMVGGKRDSVYNRPVRFSGTVELARPAAYRFGGKGYTGIGMDMGLSAVLRCGKVYLLVTSKPVLTVDPALYRAVGLEPAEAQVVVVKSHIQFRAGYAGIAREVLLLDTPGMSSDHLAALDYRRVGRPLFPLDRATDVVREGEGSREGFALP